MRTRVIEIIRNLCRQRGVKLVEGHLMTDHILMFLKVPPKISIAFVIGFLKGKSYMLIHKTIIKKQEIYWVSFLSSRLLCLHSGNL
jgi:putative transposase